MEAQEKQEEYLQPRKDKWISHYFYALKDHFSHITMLNAGLTDGKAVTTVDSDRLFVTPKFSKQAIDPAKDPNYWEETFVLDELLEKHKRLFLLGDPGTGKTTMVGRVSTIFARFMDNKAKTRFGDLVPFPIILREMPLNTVNTWEDLMTAFFDRPYFKDAHYKVKYNPEKVKALMEKGQAFFLLDGLGEITDANKRKKIASIIEKQISDFPDCNWWITLVW